MSEAHNQAPTIADQPDPVNAGDSSDLFALIPKWAPYAVLALTALIYSRVLFNDFVNIDDDAFILKNPLVREFNWGGLKAIFTSFQNGKYQPLVNFSFLLEYSFFGFNPVVFHLTNVLLHLASTWIVYRFTEQLSGKQVTAIVVSVLFAIHPMHVEEVAWAAERKDVLYAVFFLWGMLTYLKYLGSGLQKKFYWETFGIFILAVFSKSTAMTLPLVLLAIDIYKGRKMTLGAWLEKLPFVLAGATFAVIGELSQHGMVGTMPESINFVNRIFLITTVPAFYIVKLFAPFGLSVMHYYPDVTDGLLPWEYYASALVLLLAIWFVIRRSPLRRETLFGAAFFTITIAVMEQITSVGPSLTPERYTYIPYIGLFYIIGQYMAYSPVSRQRTVAIVFSLFLAMFCFQTWARVGIWKQSDMVFKDVIQKNSDVGNSFEFYFMRGDVKAAEKDFKGALEDYNQAIALNPSYAEAYTNRGAIYFQTGDYRSALIDLNMAIRIRPKRPKPYENRAALKATIGDLPGALEDFTHCLQLDSNDSRVFLDRGYVHMQLKDTVAACSDWKRSSELGNKEARNFLRQFCRQPE